MRARAPRKCAIIKQADIVLLSHLFSNLFDAETIARNFDYYERRCDHGSSLSSSIHALVAARLGRLEEARRYLHQAASIDLDDSMGNTAQGIHSGAAGGLWQAMIMGFAGMMLAGDRLSFDPHLLPEWKSLAFAVLFRGNRFEVILRAAPGASEFVLAEGDGASIKLQGRGQKYLTRAEQKWVT